MGTIVAGATPVVDKFLYVLGLPATLMPALTRAAADPLATGNELSSAIVDERLRVLAPEGVLQNFYDAQSGRLMLYYQLFFPLFLGERGYASARSLETLSRGTLAQIAAAKNKHHFWSKRHRILALRAVASIHALPAATSEDEANELRELILQVHREALFADPRAPLVVQWREIIEIVWQNMTSTLIRNRRRNWRRFSVGAALLKEAAEVCSLFLDSNEELLFAASAAWQFILTYEIAVRDRGDDAELAAVLDARKVIEARTSEPRSRWLTVMTDQYKSRQRYGNVLPQYSEAVMVRGSLRPGTAARRTTDFLTLMRLRMSHISHEVGFEGRTARYMPDVERARETSKSSLSFLANFGLVPSEWGDLRRLSQQLALPFPDETLRYLDNCFADYEIRFKASLLEQGDIIERAHLVPFRQHDERTLADRTLSELSSKELRQLSTATPDESGLRDVLGLVAGYAINSDQPGSQPVVISDALQDRLSSDLDLIASEAEYVNGWERLQPDLHAELVHKTNVPVSIGLAGSGGPLALGERIRKEVAPEKTDPHDEDANANLAPTSLCKIRFKEEWAARGAGTLLRNARDAFSPLGHDTYVVTRRTLAVLDVANICYEDVHENERT